MICSAGLKTLVGIIKNNMVPDIADSTEARDVVGFYEWALGDDVGIHTTWNEIEKDISVDAKYVSSHDIDCKYFH
jgi:hypothetical protein